MMSAVGDFDRTGRLSLYTTTFSDDNNTLYRNGAEWKFRAVGQGYASGLRGIALDFGVNVS